MFGKGLSLSEKSLLLLPMLPLVPLLLGPLGLVLGGIFAMKKDDSLYDVLVPSCLIIALLRRKVNARLGADLDV